MDAPAPISQCNLFVPFSGNDLYYAYPYTFRGLAMVRFTTLDGAEMHQRLRRGTGAKFHILLQVALTRGDLVPLVPIGEWYVESGLDHADVGRRHRVKRLQGLPINGHGTVPAACDEHEHKLDGSREQQFRDTLVRDGDLPGATVRSGGESTEQHGDEQPNDGAACAEHHAVCADSGQH